MDIAANLKLYRSIARLSQSQLAAKAGIPLNTLQNWEQGQRTPTDLKAIVSLSAALGISLDRLVSPQKQARKILRKKPGQSDNNT